MRKGKCGSGVLKLPVDCAWSLDKMKCYEIVDHILIVITIEGSLNES